jgi:hypothetical protein
MKHPVEVYIAAAAIIGLVAGYVAAAVFHRVSRHRAELAGYNAARRFYERKADPDARRI